MKNALKNGAKRINIDMDRLEFLKICQKAAVIPKSAGAELKYYTKDVIVRHNEVDYYPEGYMLTFDNKGNPKHTAILHSLRANSVISASLDKVQKI
jgi:hypothetical protein